MDKHRKGKEDKEGEKKKEKKLLGKRGGGWSKNTGKREKKKKGEKKERKEEWKEGELVPISIELKGTAVLSPQRRYLSNIHRKIQIVHTSAICVSTHTRLCMIIRRLFNK